MPTYVGCMHTCTYVHTYIHVQYCTHAIDIYMYIITNTCYTNRVSRQQTTHCEVYSHNQVDLAASSDVVHKGMSGACPAHQNTAQHMKQYNLLMTIRNVKVNTCTHLSRPFSGRFSCGNGQSKQSNNLLTSLLQSWVCLSWYTCPSSLPVSQGWAGGGCEQCHL